MSKARDHAWGIVAGTIALVSVATRLMQGWVPLDEGTIALAARFVGLGYLPHRDFAYPYTGALAAWDALAMRAFGDAMTAPRVALFVGFAAWLPAVWILARRAVGPVGAGATVVLASWWSVYVYPAAMPTWYLLFLATWMLVALARWRETVQPRWLMLGGLLCGAAIAVKQTGMYVLFAALAGILAYEQDTMREPRAPRAGPTGASASFRIRPAVVGLLGLALGVVPLLVGIRRGLASGELLTVTLPALLVMGGLVARERSLVACGDPPGAGYLLRAWAIVLAGAAIPVGVLVAWYAVHGAVGALVEGAFLRGLITAATIDRAASPAVAIAGFGAVAYALAALLARPRRPFHRFFGGILVASAFGVWAMYSVTAYRVMWHGAQLLAPAGVAFAVLIGARAHAAARDRTLGGHLIALAAAVALVALNQFPYAAPNYFAYVAPLALVLAATLVGAARHDGLQALIPMRVVTRLTRTPFLVMLLLLAGGWFHRIGSVQTVGAGSVWWDDAHLVPGPHGGLRVIRADSVRHARLLELINAHGSPNRFAAGPELPQLYVLAGTRRLVPQPFLLGPGPGSDTVALSRALDPAQIDLVAINHAPLFLAVPSPGVRAWIAARFPNAQRVDDIEVRWR